MPSQRDGPHPARTGNTATRMSLPPQRRRKSPCATANRSAQERILSNAGPLFQSGKGKCKHCEFPCLKQDALKRGLQPQAILIQQEILPQRVGGLKAVFLKQHPRAQAGGNIVHESLLVTFGAQKSRRAAGSPFLCVQPRLTDTRSPESNIRTAIAATSERFIPLSGRK